MICNLITQSNILTYNKQEETIQTKTKRKNSGKKKRKRCHKCNKKLPLIPINCKCSLHFCNLCRDPNVHNCTFDYKKDNSNILQNCGGGKFEKIQKIE